MVRRVAALVAAQINNQLKMAVEALDEIKLQVAKIPAIHDDTAELVSDMRAVKEAIKETNLDMQALEERVSRLETAAYHA